MSWISYARSWPARVRRAPHGVDDFGSDAYQRHNARRLEHLASLRIPTAGKTVLEVGAGTGDHSSYFLDRGCTVTITEAREGNLAKLRRRYPSSDVRHLDLEQPEPLAGAPFEVVYCYGVLYHLRHPAEALRFLAQSCSGILLLETCVSFGDELAVNPVAEDSVSLTQAVSGRGCRPTRPWLFRELEGLFPYVYVPLSQPNHEQFPINWSQPTPHRGLSRAVFIASREVIDDEGLLAHLPMQQSRQQ